MTGVSNRIVPLRRMALGLALLLGAAAVAQADPAIRRKDVSARKAPSIRMAPGPAGSPMPAAAPKAAPTADVSLSALGDERLPSVVYPPESRRAGEQGRVLVRVLVDERGRVAEAVVKQSSGYPRLDQAALAAVRQAKFNPYTVDGKPQPVHASIPFAFKLN